jgi:predicted O-methyltransferase YrrM
MAIIELPNRQAVANWLPADSVGVEIGVDEGVFAALLVQRCREYHGIDWWTATGKQAKKAKTEAALQPYLMGRQVLLHDADVSSVLPAFPDAYFDWVYVDGNHFYANVVRDIALAIPKIRPGGILAGHDFVLGVNSWETSVMRAVLECIQVGKIEMLALSREQFVDWIARKKE